MSTAMYAALFFTVALLFTTAYFLLGSVPLLILKHDTPLDSRFVRSFFSTYYLAAIVTATGTSVSFAVAERPMYAMGAACLAILAATLRWKLIPKMDSLRAQIQVDNGEVISSFRKTHIVAILINLVQLVVVVWSLLAFSL